MREILEYIRNSRHKGLNDEEIKESLQSVGWSSQKVEEALKADSDNIPLPPMPTSAPTTERISEPVGNVSMWDTFEHILMFISLYALAIALAFILHQLIDQWITDPAVYNYNYYSDNNWQAEMLRSYLATVIVSYPLFVFFFSRISRKTEVEPLLRRLKARKLLIYLTLIVTFVTFMTVIGQFIYKFLGGALTGNFVAHAATTVILTGIVFYYYLQQVKDDRKAFTEAKL